jgi:uncharacterized RDD family membrane protein YckC
MNVERHEHASRLFLEARSLEFGERRRFLDESCAEDEELRIEVESLLVHDGPTGEIACLTEQLPIVEVVRELAGGEELGRYRILRLLGEGGMGRVYEAEETDSARRVALKTVSSAIASEAMTRRLLEEGRLAASVNHPNTVYVFGAEEIEGTLVVSMELMMGGTLADRVRASGPMSAVEAVDAVLEIVSGLEAIQSAGILHRDIKPSNCFIGGDGRIKIGDFGISVSGSTASGPVLGTPSFASPEQLRGEEADVRSDLYSVGATLYYLLTGSPPSAAEQKRRLPRFLEPIVLRCLSEDPGRRFASYAELSEALRPLSSTRPTPADRGTRLLAWVIDWVLLSGVLLLTVGLTPSFREQPVLTVLGMAVGVLLYFGVTEARWGASVGKLFTGLRVAGTSGEPPRLGKTLVRAALPTVLLVPGWYFGLEFFVASWIALALLSLTAIHDRISRSRVIISPDPDREGGRATPAPAPERPRPGADAASIGPYLVLERLGGDETGDLLLAYDPKLRRDVWIRRLRPGAPELPPARRELRRPTRLRWLAGKRTAEEAWDAFEAAPGRSLAESRDSWRAVRVWLTDLAEETGAGLADRTLPATLHLNQVWITTGGRVKLLDFPAPGTDEDRSWSPGDFRSMQRTLCEVARRALGTTPLPIAAGRLLDDLCAGRVQDPTSLRDRLRALLETEPEVTRRQRARHLRILSLPSVAGAVLALFLLTGALIESWKNLPGFLAFAAAAPVLVLCQQSLVALPLVFLLRGGLLFRLAGIDVVTANGERASRSRCLSRAAVAWSPVWGLVLIGVTVGAPAMALLSATYFALVAWIVWRTRRSPQDRIAGTFLVPRCKPT